MDQSPAAAAQRLAFNKQELISAVFTGDTETVVDLLDGGVPIDTKDDEGRSLLHLAAGCGHVNTLRLLIRRGCNVDSIDGRGLTPLHLAVAKGQKKAVQDLIRNGASKSVVAGDVYGPPLHQAAFTGHVETVVAMLEKGCPLDKVNSVGDTVLHFAAKGGNVELVRELVGRGCDVNAVQAYGCTPLHDAAAHGRTAAVRELIKLGATKSMVAGMFGTPLHQAAINGHVETAVAMLEEGCPLDVVSSAGATVLHFAAEGGHVEIVRELVGRGCDVNAVKADGCTPLHSAAGHGRTEAVNELIKLGATKSVVVGWYGTPLHRAIVNGHVECVEALLEDEYSKPDLTSHDVTPSEAQVLDSGIIGTCNSFGETPVMWALRCGQVEVFKLLISKGGTIPDRDTNSLSAFEHCFLGGQVSKLSHFCKACGIGSSGEREGFHSALATLINQGLVDAHKVLCLCAISGDILFLEDQFSELVASDTCAMPAAVKCAKYYFSKGASAPFISQLSIPDGNALNPLQMALLSFKCFEMGFAILSIQRGVKDHTSFITKLLSHPVLKETVHENFPNGLSPLDLAQQFELHHIAALIEGAGGHPGVWADIPQEIQARHPVALPQVRKAYASFKAIAEDGEHGLEFIKDVVSSILGGQTVETVVHVADDSQLVKEQILGQCPDLGDVVTHVLPCIQVRHWKRVGLALGLRKNSLDELGQQFPNDDDRCLETMSYWLEHDSSVTWTTLLDVLGHFETKHTVDELTDKIVSVLGGGDQVPLQLPSPSVSTGHIEETSSKRTAQPSWPPAKQRRTSDAEGVACLRKRSPEGDMHDQPPAKRVVRCALTGSEGIVEAVSVSSSTPVVSREAVAAERNPPVCEGSTKYGPLKSSSSSSWEMSEELPSPCAVQALEEGRALSEQPLIRATHVQVVQEHAKEFLEMMNSKVIAPQLRALELIPESVEYDILHSKTEGNANAYLLKHLKVQVNVETLREVFRIASNERGYGKTSAFAAGVLRELQ